VPLASRSDLLIIYYFCRTEHILSMIEWLTILHITQYKIPLVVLSVMIFFILNYLIITVISRYRNYKDLRFISNNSNFYIYLFRHFVSGKNFLFSLLLVPLEILLLFFLIPGLSL
jgi:hypothetical protein